MKDGERALALAEARLDEAEQVFLAAHGFTKTLLDAIVPTVSSYLVKCPIVKQVKHILKLRAEVICLRRETESEQKQPKAIKKAR